MVDVENGKNIIKSLYINLLGVNCMRERTDSASCVELAANEIDLVSGGVPIIPPGVIAALNVEIFIPAGPPPSPEPVGGGVIMT